MRSREIIARARTPAGEEITLRSEGGHLVVSLAGATLMSSAAHHSEEQMAAVGCAGLGASRRARVLVAGLGMGYTVRAALDVLPPTARVVVVELVPEIVEWNRGPLADLAARPLEDPRVRLEVADVVVHLRSVREPYDAILLDLDNGPDALTTKGNDRIYQRRGLSGLRHALRPGGALVIWSAYLSPTFPAALREAGLAPEVVRARSRGKKGSHHVLYVGRRPPGRS